MTNAEQALWKSLRMRQMAEAKFRRQQPIGPYIVDFVSFGSRLVVEADGGQHAQQADSDAKRTAWLEGQGFRVLRFWDHEILQTPDAVKRVIWEALTPPPQSSPTRGEEAKMSTPSPFGKKDSKISTLSPSGRKKESKTGVPSPLAGHSC
jgi:very-short-patch-repair endonuclease